LVAIKNVQRDTKYIKSTLTLIGQVLTVKGNRFDYHVGYDSEWACTIRSTPIQTALRKP